VTDEEWKVYGLLCQAIFFVCGLSWGIVLVGLLHLAYKAIGAQ